MKTWTLARKEFFDLLLSPAASVFLVVFLFVMGWLFSASFFVMGEASMREYFRWLPLLLLIFLPTLTMGRWSDERRLGTFELLLTLPLTHGQRVLGKFLGVMAFVVLMLVFMAPIAAVVDQLGSLDRGVVLSGFVGTLMLCGVYVAAGLVCSMVTRSAVASYVLTVLILFVALFLAEPLVLRYVPESVREGLIFLSLQAHWEPTLRGVLDVRDGVYLLTWMGALLSLNGVLLHRRGA